LSPVNNQRPRSGKTAILKAIGQNRKQKKRQRPRNHGCEGDSRYYLQNAIYAARLLIPPMQARRYTNDQKPSQANYTKREKLRKKQNWKEK
jgi:hypothetical protein